MFRLHRFKHIKAAAKRQCTYETGNHSHEQVFVRHVAQQKPSKEMKQENVPRMSCAKHRAIVEQQRRLPPRRHRSRRRIRCGARGASSCETSCYAPSKTAPTVPKSEPSKLEKLGKVEKISRSLGTRQGLNFLNVALWRQGSR